MPDSILSLVIKYCYCNFLNTYQIYGGR